ncbi:cell division protein ZapE [Rhodococcus sp. LW-XY12]|uniref:cell division protein ZapE n=1 Tax=Rhodococcus sp. LW-XY12 TaxID=2856851 RepID=UPI0027D7CB24|nr:cell division protein ZapE [Rhodococcus sp. LW-XY12]
MRLRRRRSRMSPNTASSNPVPRTVFEDASRSRGFVLDPAQHDAVEQLCHPERPNVYLWGPPGRGKSWLADVYFSAYPGRNKLRVHFHEFFRDLHVELRRHRFDLDAALDHLIGRAELVCFDEFHVHDPADGTFVARLFPALLARRTRLVLTSNYPPRDLLPNPLFHDGFVPTIELVERSATIVALDGPRDHRLGSDHAKGFASGIWAVSPSDPQLRRLGLERPAPVEHRVLRPAGRPLRALRAEKDCLWFDFRDLCGHPTAPADYLALAADHLFWVVDKIPDLTTVGREPAQRFANLVDVLHDRDVRVVFVSEVAASELAAAVGPVAHDIGRLRSRLAQLRTIQDTSARTDAGRSRVRR